MHPHNIAVFGSEGVGKTCLLETLRFLGDGHSREDGIDSFSGKDSEAKRVLLDLAEARNRNEPVPPTSADRLLDFSMVYSHPQVTEGKKIRTCLRWLDYKGEGFRMGDSQITQYMLGSEYWIILLSPEDFTEERAANVYGAISDMLFNTPDRKSRRVAFVITKSDMQPELFEEGAAEQWYRQVFPKMVEAAQVFKSCSFTAISVMEQSPENSAKVNWRPEPRGVNELFEHVMRGIWLDSCERKRLAATRSFIRNLVRAGIAAGVAALLGFGAWRCYQSNQRVKTSAEDGNPTVEPTIFTSDETKKQIDANKLEELRGEMNTCVDHFGDVANGALRPEDYEEAKSKIDAILKKGQQELGNEENRHVLEKCGHVCLEKLQYLVAERLKKDLAESSSLEAFCANKETLRVYGFSVSAFAQEVADTETRLIGEWRTRKYGEIRAKSCGTKALIREKLNLIVEQRKAEPQGYSDLLFRSKADYDRFVEMKNRIESYLSCSEHKIFVHGMSDSLNKKYECEVRVMGWKDKASYVKANTKIQKNITPEWEESIMLNWEPGHHNKCMVEVWTYTGKNRPLLQTTARGPLAVPKAIMQCRGGELSGEGGIGLRMNIDYGKWSGAVLKQTLDDFRRFMEDNTYWNETE